MNIKHAGRFSDSEAVTEFINSQQDLSEEDKKVLHNNLWRLYDFTANESAAQVETAVRNAEHGQPASADPRGRLSAKHIAELAIDFPPDHPMLEVCRQALAALDLQADLAKANNEIARYRRALQVIRDSPGGGPGKRIAIQALGAAAKEKK